MINITSRANARMLIILDKYKSKNMLFSIKSGGCNGFNYNLEPTNNDPLKYDELVRINNSHNVIICGKSLFKIIGTTIDWKSDILGEYFHFDNPNSTMKCGCGKSFT